jgi:hypothetical protein
MLRKCARDYVLPVWQLTTGAESAERNQSRTHSACRVVSRIPRKRNAPRGAGRVAGGRSRDR